MQDQSKAKRKLKAKRIVPCVVASVTAVAITTSIFLQNPSNVASADKVVDFNSGSYSEWDGVSYDFSWYTSSVDDVYTISSAAQLASLSILTNDLSHGQNGEWDDIIANVHSSVSDTTKANEYIALADTFVGKTIKLTKDIDLKNFDWLPISYPWKTANLSASYTFTNTEGETVSYNAVDHIPDETVDEWVGDVNGDPISTRYWEFPESEMRFRDLVNYSFLSDTERFATEAYEIDDSRLCELDYSMQAAYFPVKAEIVKTYLKPVDYKQEIVASYTYKNIKGFTETNGFEGTFDGGVDEHKIKGLKPETPWTDDYEERLHTYDPLGKGLFSMIGEKGEVKNISVKGAIDDEVYSYSAFLCAYNYGTIDNCYVDGTMKQGLVDMVFPVARDYAPNGNSTYALSNDASPLFSDVPSHGTVMPVGNSGFMTSINYGTIKNSHTVGEVTQAFRQFGFFASVNNGEIIGCQNRADLSTEDVVTDFITDEWTFDLTDHHVFIDYNKTSYVPFTFIPVRAQDWDYQVGTPTYSVYPLEIDEDETAGVKTFHLKTLSSRLPVYYINNVQETPSRYEVAYGWKIILGSYSANNDSRDSSNIIYRGDVYSPLFSSIGTWDGIMPWQTNKYLENREDGNNINYNTAQYDWRIKGRTYLRNYLSVRDLHTVITDSPNLLMRPEMGYAIGEDFYPYNSDHSGRADKTITDMGAWMPVMYNADDLESVAANHLYGVYSLTTVGGICAINNNLVKDCSNTGDIAQLGNTSTRTAYKMEMDRTKRDSLSYIRPNNQYALFSTVVNTANYGGGITGVNLNTIIGCKHSGSVVADALSDGEKYKNNIELTIDENSVDNALYGTFKNSTTVHNSEWIETAENVPDMTYIPYTENGYYMTNAMTYDAVTGNYVQNNLATNYYFNDSTKTDAAQKLSIVNGLLDSITDINNLTADERSSILSTLYEMGISSDYITESYKRYYDNEAYVQKASDGPMIYDFELCGIKGEIDQASGTILIKKAIPLSTSNEIENLIKNAYSHSFPAYDYDDEYYPVGTISSHNDWCPIETLDWQGGYPKYCLINGTIWHDNRKDIYSDGYQFIDATPTIVWQGDSITPDENTSQDFLGVTKKYHKDTESYVYKLCDGEAGEYTADGKLIYANGNAYLGRNHIHYNVNYDEDIYTVDFSYPVTYTVTKDGKSKTYNVKFQFFGDTEGSIEALSDTGFNGCDRYSDYLVRYLHLLKTNYENLIASELGNMPYPYTKPQIVDCTQTSGGISAMNAGIIKDSDNTGAADNGICEFSAPRVGLEALIENCKQDSKNTTISNICNVAIDTDIIDCSSDGIVATTYDPSLRFNTNTIGGIANFVYAIDKDVILDNNTVYSGTGQYNTVVGNNRTVVKNSVIYDDVHTGGGFATASDTKFENVYNFQKSSNGIATMDNCDVDEAYVYNDCGNGVGKGTMNYCNNFNYYGMDVDTILGEITAANETRQRDSLIFSNINVLMLRKDGSIGKCKRMYDGGDFTLENARVFCNFGLSFLRANNAEIENFIVYGDSLENLNNKQDYITKLSYSDCTDMVFEMNLDYQYNDYLTTMTIEDIPGVLKVYEDTNTYKRCAIQVPDGMVTYESRNFLDASDDSITSDARLSYDENARASGALAYVLDKGDTDNRTFEWSVAHDDAFDHTANVNHEIDWTLLTDTFETVALPAHTRKIESGESLEPFYSFSIPYTGAGAGEVVGTVTRPNETYSTHATGEIFPKTVLYTHAGEQVDLAINAIEGHELLGMWRATKDGTVKIESELPSTEPYKRDFEITGDYDIQIICDWADTHKIEIDDEFEGIIDLKASSDGAIVGRTINVSAVTLTSDYEIGKIYYCPYVKDSNNLLKLDLNTKVAIPLQDMTFDMPDCDIRIFVTPYNTGNYIKKFVLAGSNGIINNETNSIEVVIDEVVDLSSIAPTEIKLSTNATVAPIVGATQDFRTPVKYVVTSESGSTRTYTVKVSTKKDGYISMFEALGYLGKIEEVDDTHGTVTFNVADSFDITNVNPTIIWGGLSITPTGAQDFTSPVTYEITMADGLTVREYTVIFNQLDSTVALHDVELSSGEDKLSVSIDTVNKKIIVAGPYGANFAHVNVDAIQFIGQTINIEPNEELNLTVAKSVVVVDNVGVSEIYDFVVTELPSDFKNIKQFMLCGENGVIDESARTITVTLPASRNITNLRPMMVAYEGKEISDLTASHDFTSPVTYTVTAYDGTTKDYTVIVVQ